MNIVILIVFGIVLFGSLTICRRWKESFFLIAFAIGCACNANYFNSFSAPVNFANMVFSVDSILYTMFLFTIALKFFNYPLNETKGMIFASIVAIIISAFIELFATLTISGLTLDSFKVFIRYILSAIGSLLAIFVMILYLNRAEKRNANRYLSLVVAIFIGSILNSACYYGINAIISSERIDNFLSIFLGSAIGKTYATILSLLSYLIYEKFLKKKDEIRDN